MVIVLQTLYNTDLWQAPYQWFGTVWVPYISPMFCLTHGLDISKYNGVIGLAPYYDANATDVQAYIARTHFNLSAGYNVRDLTPYDTMYVSPRNHHCTSSSLH
jgi:hypothetical protein